MARPHHEDLGDQRRLPLYVLELLMHHELLHAEMPHAGHNADFRAHERLFAPSEQAADEARELGVQPGSALGAWRALADMFLGAFEHRFLMRRPGTWAAY